MVNKEEDPVGSYFLDLWKSRLSKDDVFNDDNEETEEVGPTELDTLKSSGGFSIVLPDKLSVKYPNVNLHGHDVGVVQANNPAPVNCLVYYFEIFVKNAGVKGHVSIGFTTQGFNLRRQPGWDANSFGYHGDDGLIYQGQGKGDAFGPTYTTGDTVGGGINYASQQFFFTKNGQVVGSVPINVTGRLYPTVGVHSQNEEVSVNFGKDPFLFDIKAYEASQRAEHQRFIERLSISPTASYGIVRSYLQHYGYEETLGVFDEATLTSVPPITGFSDNGFNEHNHYALHHRKILRQQIKDGQIDDAFAKLREWYPVIVQDDTSVICFMLHCQKFIELVRVGSLEEAVCYGKAHFEKFYSLKDYEDLVKDCAALLAYLEPKKSPVGYLLEDTQRENVADAVNAMILSTNPALKDQRSCLHSYLERLLKQLSACFLEKRLLNGNQGEAFHLRRVLLSKST
ncbi:SPla/RYanodine receptor (SPRY) domain-containing protein [Artemisia annua]|uniref:SPla/RYanodine receptor (SPRY) domain-containing protein n=1 Tax=Artemisia annua TaxID=35608 RepID=A0A2U1PMW4_ARTAN|nr:SPla/RYanodine receptor (SPRY) domain-containing protein [Artemisia annua]